MKIKNLGIYLISNTYNGKVYVGSTEYLHKRFIEHVSRLKAQTHHNRHLQRAWNKFGEVRFTFEVLEHVAEEAQLTTREAFWITHYKATNRTCGYNIRTLDECGRIVFPNGGEPKTAEHREKLRLAATGKTPTDETRQKMSKAKQGMRHSPERVAARVKASKLVAYDLTHLETGHRVQGNNLAQFARDNTLHVQNLRKVITGERNQAKGWYLTANLETHAQGNN